MSHKRKFCKRNTSCGMPDRIACFVGLFMLLEYLPLKFQVPFNFQNKYIVSWHKHSFQRNTFYLLKISFSCPVFFPLSWDIEGAVYGTQCGEIESGSALVFDREGRRRVCTPYLDTTSYGNLRFHFTMGMEIPRPSYLNNTLSVLDTLSQWDMCLLRRRRLRTGRVPWERCGCVWKVGGQEGARGARHSSVLFLQGETWTTYWQRISTPSQPYNWLYVISLLLIQTCCSD